MLALNFKLIEVKETYLSTKALYFTSEGDRCGQLDEGDVIVDGGCVVQRVDNRFVRGHSHASGFTGQLPVQTAETHHEIGFAEQN